MTEYGEAVRSRMESGGRSWSFRGRTAQRLLPPRPVQDSLQISLMNGFVSKELRTGQSGPQITQAGSGRFDQIHVHQDQGGRAFVPGKGFFKPARHERAARVVSEESHIVLDLCQCRIVIAPPKLLTEPAEHRVNIGSLRIELIIAAKQFGTRQPRKLSNTRRSGPSPHTPDSALQ